MQKLTKKLTITKIPLTEGNRMIRVGGGQNKGIWFFRVDLWFNGWRITKASQ